MAILTDHHIPEHGAPRVGRWRRGRRWKRLRGGQGSSDSVAMDLRVGEDTGMSWDEACPIPVPSGCFAMRLCVVLSITPRTRAEGRPERLRVSRMPVASRPTMMRVSDRLGVIAIKPCSSLDHGVARKSTRGSGGDPAGG